MITVTDSSPRQINAAILAIIRKLEGLEKELKDYNAMTLDIEKKLDERIKKLEQH